MKSLSVLFAATSLVSASAFAEPVIRFSIPLKVHAKANIIANCPTNDLLTVKGSEKYTEESSEISGGIELTRIATDLVFVESTENSVTWGAKLKPKYTKCVAAAWELYQDQKSESTYTLDFENGYVYFTLSVEGFQNNESGAVATITYQDIKSGIPVFRFSIAD